VLVCHHLVAGLALSFDGGVLNRVFITSVPLFIYVVSGLVYNTRWREIGIINSWVTCLHPRRYHSVHNLSLLVKGSSRFPPWPLRLCGFNDNMN